MTTDDIKKLRDDFLPVINNYINFKIKSFCDLNNISCKMDLDIYTYSDEYVFEYDYICDDFYFRVEITYPTDVKKNINVSVSIVYVKLNVTQNYYSKHDRNKIHVEIMKSMDYTYNSFIKQLQEYIDEISKLRLV